MQAGLHIDVRPAGPPTVPDESNAFHDAITAQEGVELSEDIIAAFEKAKASAVTAVNGREFRPGDDVVVVPLGTGSACPARYRNGTLFNLEALANCT